MILQQLVEYGRKAGLDVEPGFKPKTVKWGIRIRSDGSFIDIIELGEPGPKNKGCEFSKCPDLGQRELIAGGITRSHFLVDTAPVIALMQVEDDDRKTRAKHEFFRQMTADAAKQVPSLEPLAVFLNDSAAIAALCSACQSNKVKPIDRCTFIIDSTFPVQENYWHCWWRAFRNSIIPQAQTDDQVDDQMLCFLTGELVTPAKTHPKIEGLAGVGGLSTGDVLIGFDKDSFGSYGLQQSENAALSEESAAAYRASLNHLIAKSSFSLAGMRIIYWFKEIVPDEDNPFPAIVAINSQSDEIAALDRFRNMLTAIKNGERPDLAANRYFVFIVSGASGRIMVRDWQEGEFKDLLTNILSWFSDLEIINREGSASAPPPKLMAVAGSIVRDLKDIPNPLLVKIWRSAVKGEAIPEPAFAQALGRCKMDILSDHPFNHARMGLLRAALNRKERIKQGVQKMDHQLKPSLNPDHPDPVYHCGRLMALLADLQYKALGDVGAGVVQRYYAAASVTPALVLGRLVRTAQFHLGKLTPGLASIFNSRIGEAISRIGDKVPNNLSLAQQSLFALGYYQQLSQSRADRTQAIASHNENATTNHNHEEQ